MVMKKVLFVFVIFALLALSTPLFVGYMVKQQYRDMLYFLNTHDNISAQNVMYQKDFLSAHATTELKISFRNGNHAERFLVEHHLLHGPIIIGDDGSSPFKLAEIKSKVIEIPESVAFAKLVLVDEKALLDIKTHLYYTGMDTTWIKSSPFKKQLSPETFLQWGGATSTVHHAKDWKKIKFDIKAPKLNIQENDNIFEIVNFNFVCDVKQSTIHWWSGIGEFAFQALVLQENGKRLFELKDFKTKIDSYESNGLVNEDMDFDLESMIIVNKTYGPSHITLRLRNFDAKSLLAFKKISSKINGDKQTNQALEEEALSIFSTWLSKAPEIEIEDSHIQFPEGKLRFSGEMLLGGREVKDIKDIFTVVQSIEARIFLLIPKALMHKLVKSELKKTTSQSTLTFSWGEGENAVPVPQEKTKTQLAQELDTKTKAHIENWVLEGVLIESEKDYQIQIYFKEGESSINGKKRAIPWPPK